VISHQATKLKSIGKTFGFVTPQFYLFVIVFSDRIVTIGSNITPFAQNNS
jgi:hypothetical protein